MQDDCNEENTQFIYYHQNAQALIIHRVNSKFNNDGNSQDTNGKVPKMRSRNLKIQ